MILCPNCQHQELPGALFCSECGAQLVGFERLTTQTLKKTPSDSLSYPSQTRPDTDISTGVEPSEGTEIAVSLFLIDSGQTLNLVGRKEFALGRIAEGQPILPDVDLSSFEAYAQGVSRLHAAIKIHETGVVVTDLGSSNGTRVNGQKIVPHVDYPIRHGDIISLGKLKMQVLINK